MNHKGAVTYRYVAGSSCRLDCGVQSTEADEAPWADNVGVHVDQKYAHGSTFADSNPTANNDILMRRSRSEGRDGDQQVGCGKLSFGSGHRLRIR